MVKKILVIEDDLALLENTAEILRLEGYKVYTAFNGREGIEKARKYVPNLIISDIMMPETDGYDVLEAISLDPSTSHIPFIFLSAKTEYREIRQGMEMGADDYLAKPFEEEDLLKAIKSRMMKSENLSNIVLQQKSMTTISESVLRNLNELKNFFDDNGEVLNFEKGETIYNEGEHTNKIYLILKGIVKSYKINRDGKELTTALHKPDEFLGLTSFIENLPYHESAIAVKPVKLAGVSKDMFKGMLNSNQHVCLELMDVMNEHLLRMYEQLLHMAYSSVYSKTAQTLIQFSAVLGKDAMQPFKIRRSELASAAGIATESLIRTLSSFKKDGLIDIDGRFIQILDLNGVKALV